MRKTLDFPRSGPGWFAVSCLLSAVLILLSLTEIHYTDPGNYSNGILINYSGHEYNYVTLLIVNYY